jgi:cellobiose dehydrogenase (acceptor)
MQVATAPYLREQGDTDAVIAALESMAKAVKKNPLIEFAVPAPGVSIKEYVNSVSCFFLPLSSNY